MSTVAVSRSLNRTTTFYNSVLGKKIAMAITGVILFGFVVVHMVGNLQAFIPPGPDGVYALDVYGQKLRAIPPVLWGARLILLAAVLIHIVAAWQLIRVNKFEARPERYVKKASVGSTYASRTMVWSGPILFFYIGYHLLHLTTGTVHGNFIEGAVHHNLITGLSNPIVALFYAVANIMLALHLYHGVWSMFQTLGVSHPKYSRWLRQASVAFAVIVGAGFLSIPLAVMAGILKA